MFPTSDKHLGQKAGVVYCPDFETGVIKALKGHGKLSPAEKAALQVFEIRATSVSAAAAAATVADEASPGDETNVERWVRMAQEIAQSKVMYRSMMKLCPTSVICERVFSDAKHIMTDDTRYMDPSTIEIFLILKYNEDFWGACTIDMIANRDDAPVTGQNIVVICMLMNLVLVLRL